MTYRKDIQILRGIAVFLVVLFHLGIGGFDSGFLGVDVFFVISGFLMAILYDERRKLEFYKRRALRLLPAYFVTVLISLGVSIIMVTPNEYIQVFDQAISASFFTSNLFYWSQNSYFSKSEFNPLLHLWSLGVEIQFYLLVPLIFFFPRINKHFYWILTLISLGMCFIVVGISPKTSFFMMPLRLWEFLIGYGVAKYFTTNGAIHSRFDNGWIGSLFLVAILAIPLIKVQESLSIISGHPGLFALFISLSTGIVLACGINRLFEDSLLGNLLELIGKYSYSIYLVHFPVIVFVLYQPFAGTLLNTENVTILLILVGLIVLLSWGMFVFAEEKLRKIKHVSSMLVMMPLLIVTIAYVGQGVQSLTYSGLDMAISQAFQDRDNYRCGKLFRVRNPTALVCKLNNLAGDAEHRLMLVGDSHADSIKLVFTNVATSKNTEVFFLVPNNPLMKGNIVDVERVLNEATALEVKSLVVHYSPGAIDVSTIQELVQGAGSRNIFVAFLMPVPTWNEHIPRALWNHNHNGSPLPTQTKGDYRNRTNGLTEALSQIPSMNLAVYSPAESLCAESCPLISDSGNPIYFDNAHLTLTGSQLLTGLFEEMLLDLTEYADGPE